jgi:hypothetical protein
VVSFTTRLLYPHVKSSFYPLDRRLGGRSRAVVDAVVKRKILTRFPGVKAAVACS